jgi:3-dehydroquinate dehydratase-2
MQVAIINGPNLNLLGTRQPHIYGSQSFDSYLPKLQAQFPEVKMVYFQSNQEGELVEAVQRFGASAEAILLNPGAFTHTSIALADAVASVNLPVYEIHLSNVFARQDFRKHSYISAQAKAVICGLGLQGYAAALQAFLNEIKSKR